MSYLEQHVFTEDGTLMRDTRKPKDDGSFPGAKPIPQTLRNAPVHFHQDGNHGGEKHSVITDRVGHELSPVDKLRNIAKKNSEQRDGHNLHNQMLDPKY